MAKGRSPSGESLPPSKMNPKPAPSLFKEARTILYALLNDASGLSSLSEANDELNVHSRVPSDKRDGESSPLDEYFEYVEEDEHEVESIVFDRARTSTTSLAGDRSTSTASR